MEGWTRRHIGRLVVAVSRWGRGISAAWGRYWFASDGRISIEVIRIALALGALMTWHRAVAPSYQRLVDLVSMRAYHPFGVMRLLGESPPPVPVLEACKWLALIASLAMLVGLASRISTLVSLLAMLVVVGMRESFSTPWHHSYTPILAAHLAFVLAPSGRMMSVDALLRRWRGLPGRAATPQPAWPALLVQLVVAIPYASAATAKLMKGGLDWALSDSLRHHILARFGWTGHPRTPVADLLVQNETLWQAAALGNLVSQLAPLFACLFVRRPRIRFALGMFYVLETIALDVVMELPNYQWLPLAVVFVDWDRLVAWLRRRRTRGGPPAEPVEPARPARAVSPVIAGFAGAHLIITFGPVGLDQRLNSFPISQYRMFSEVRAKKPYAEHQSWEFETIRFALRRKGDSIERADTRLDAIYYKKGSVRSPQEMEKILRQASRLAAHGKQLRTLTAWYTILQAPPYPDSPELIPYRIGILGRMRGKRFQSLLGRAATDEIGRPYVAPAPVGIALPAEVKLTCFLGLDPVPRPIAIERRDGRFYYTPAEPGRYLFVAEIAGERFIVAETRHRRPGR